MMRFKAHMNLYAQTAPQISGCEKYYNKTDQAQKGKDAEPCLADGGLARVRGIRRVFGAALQELLPPQADGQPLTLTHYRLRLRQQAAPRITVVRARVAVTHAAQLFVQAIEGQPMIG